jgi:hypothetical protein
MELFLQILGAIFLVILIVVGAVFLFLWWQFRKLKRDLTEAAKGLKRTAEFLGPIVLPREMYRQNDAEWEAKQRRMIEAREVTADATPVEDAAILDRAVSEGLIQQDERGWAVLVRDGGEDAERLASILELGEGEPIFSPPDERSGPDVLREGPAREAFAKLNALRSEGDQFALRGTIDDVDIYIHGG